MRSVGGPLVLVLVTFSCGDVTVNDEDRGIDGTCSADKSDCAGNVEVDLLKQNYTKITWTDDYDYAIREELDAADDMIASDQLKAVEMFEEILEHHPESARAKYAMSRALDILILNSTDIDQETLRGHCGKALAALSSILAQGHELTLMRRSASHLLQRIAEDKLCYSRPDNIRALAVMAEMSPEARYNVVLGQELFLNGDYDEALVAIERVIEKKKHEFGLNVIKSTILRIQGKEKEARAFMRELDLDDAFDNTDLNPAQVRNMRSVIVNDINYLCIKLEAEDQLSVKAILVKDASRLHLIPSQLQRPILFKADLKAQAVWPLSELQSQNRWTNAQSITGIGLNSNKLKGFQENVDIIRKEALELSSDIEEWEKDDHFLVKSGTFHAKGLFLYGKKKHETCSVTPKTCKLLKAFKESSTCKKCVSKIVLVKSGTHQIRHNGPSNEKLRAILPLQAEAGKAKLFIGKHEKILTENELVVIDDSFENALSNDSADDLLLLEMDFNHPDLTDREKNTESFSEQVKSKFVLY